MLLKEGKKTNENSANRYTNSKELLRYLGLIALFEGEASKDYIRQQIVTELGECLDGEMSTLELNPISLRVERGKLIDINSGDLTQSAWAWAFNAKKRAEQDESYSWLADTAEVEAQELDAAAELFSQKPAGAIMLSISSLPEGGISKSVLEKEGFRPDIKRTFLRAYQTTEHGLISASQSLDNMTVQRHNNIRGVDYSTSVEHLADRTIIYGSTIEEVFSNYTDKADELLHKETGKAHHKGRIIDSSIDAIAFVERHSVLVDEVINQLGQVRQDLSDKEKNRQFNNILYKAKATLTKRHKTYLKGEDDSWFEGESVSGAMSYDGGVAAANGDSFAGCSGGSMMQSSSNSLSSSMDNDSSINKFTSTFSKPSLPTNPEDIAMVQTECPICCQSVTAPYDTKRELWLGCANSSCKAYSKEAVNMGLYVPKDETILDQPGSDGINPKKDNEANKGKSEIDELKTQVHYVIKDLTNEINLINYKRYESGLSDKDKENLLRRYAECAEARSSYVRAYLSSDYQQLSQALTSPN